MKGLLNDTYPKESNKDNFNGSGNNQSNHENVLDMETKNNMSMTKALLSKELDSSLSALPICKNIPSRIHMEVCHSTMDKNLISI